MSWLISPTNQPKKEKELFSFLLLLLPLSLLYASVYKTGSAHLAIMHWDMVYFWKAMQYWLFAFLDMPLRLRDLIFSRSVSPSLPVLLSTSLASYLLIIIIQIWFLFFLHFLLAAFLVIDRLTLLWAEKNLAQSTETRNNTFLKSWKFKYDLIIFRWSM